jgi:Domain of unknown function (DUF4124)
MSGHAPRASFVLLVALSALAPVAVNAAGNDKGVTTYRWVDEQGVVHYGDRIPPQYAQKERTVLNAQGVEVRRLDAQKTPEQMAADDRIQQGVARQKQHDGFLLATYTSVKDIEALRDVRLDQLHGQHVAAEQYVDGLRSRLGALQKRAMLFKPYNQRPGAHRLPDDLATDLVHTLNELHTQDNVLVAKGEEESNLKAQFQADIERYQELHTINR